MIDLDDRSSNFEIESEIEIEIEIDQTRPGSAKSASAIQAASLQPPRPPQKKKLPQEAREFGSFSSLTITTWVVTSVSGL